VNDGLAVAPHQVPSVAVVVELAEHPELLIHVPRSLPTDHLGWARQ
jgi:hypothetical protein